MIANDVSKTETVRNVFIIDDKGIVRAILVYPMELGRFIPEIIRMVDGLQTIDKENVVLPANWLEGEIMIQKPPKTFPDLEKRLEQMNEKQNGMAWYLTFKEQSQKRIE